MKSFFSILFIGMFLSSCLPKKQSSVLTESLDIKVIDSFLLIKYRDIAIREYAEPQDSLLPIDSILNSFEKSLRFSDSRMFYAPDSSFKIATVTLEHCGGSCRDEYISWIHYNLKEKKESVESIEIGAISKIYALPNKDYLILSSWQDNRFRNYYVDHITFTNNQLIKKPMRYKKESVFYISGDNDFDTIQGIRYNEKEKILSYNFIKHNDELNIDTFKNGQFQYLFDFFFLEKEKVAVVDNRTTPAKINEWTEIYKNRKKDSVNIHIGMINDYQLVYDYSPLDNDRDYQYKNVKISTLKNNSKKELFSTELSEGSFFTSISLLTIQGNNFVYFQTTETTGNSDGYLYYIDPKTMRASEVKIDEQIIKLPKEVEPIGSYAFKALNDERTGFLTSSGIMDKKSGVQGVYIINYKLQQTTNNEFTLIAQKPELSFFE